MYQGSFFGVPPCRNPLLPRLALGLMLLSATLPAAAASDNGRLYWVDIPPGPLREAIDQLAASARLQVLYGPSVVSGRFTQGVKGSMTLGQAFERLLTTTDVTYQFTAADTVALYRKTAASVNRSRQPALTQAPSAQQPLAVVRVNAQRAGESAGSGTGTNLTSIKAGGSVLATPISFQSVTQEVLQDQQAARVEDVLEGVSGVEVAPDGQDTVGFIIRGIPVYQYYVDGVRISPDLHHDAFRDLADVASIDVVKGPASTLYGRTEPGGLINVITKQPLKNPYLSVEQEIGAFDRRRTEIDAGGPLSDTGNLLYRFNAAWESAESYREYLSNRRIFLAPVVTWNISPQGAMTAYLEYLRSSDPTDSGLPVVGGSLPPVPVERRVEDGGEVHTNDVRVGIRGWHVINDQWSMRYHLDGRWLRTPQWPQLALADDGLDPTACSPGACPVDQYLFSIPVARGQTYFSSVEFLGDLALWDTRHAILLGGEFFDVHGDSVTLYSTNGFATDLFAPQHVPVPGYLLENPDGAYATWTSERWSSAYLQDQIGIGQQVHVLLGVRYDHARQWLDGAAGIPLQDIGTDVRWDHAFKRHAGIVWRVTEPLSLYANYAENFGISTGIYGEGKGGGTGILVPPETAHEWEIGAKAALFDGRASSSLAWFDLTELNRSLPAFGLLDSQGVRAVTGAERSRGLELDLRGAILPNLELLASYAFLDTRILADVGTAVDNNGNIIITSGNEGNRLFGAPRHGGSAWVTYRPAGMLQGLKLGLGTVARTWREGDNENDYRLPGFVKWSVLVGYDWPWQRGRLALQLNVNNVFNTRYFESISGTHTVMPGAPRRWLASLRWTCDPPR
jgi:iron complex outermembrane recepter protein